MRDFHVVLPTIAPDYSGAGSALYELDGTVIVHDPSGCLGNFIGYDEPRAYDSRSRVFTSGLDEMQALLGKDDALIYAACQAHEIVRGRFVAILGSPNPMVLGTDYDAIAAIVGQRCGVPGFAVPTTGLATYADGASKAYVALAKEVVAPLAEQAGVPTGAGACACGARTVNIIGATPLDLQQQTNVDVARAALEDAGWRVVSCWSMGEGATLDDMAAGLGACCNVVLTTSGLAAAKWMRRTYGTPFIWGCLSGEIARDETLAHLERVVAGETTDVLPSASAASDGPAALVVADHVLGESMRRALERDLGYARVDLATLGLTDRASLRAGDACAPDEVALARLVRGNDYDLVVGDGLMCGFADAQTRALFAEIPCAAISSRISWSKPISPYGAGFLAAVRAACPAGERAGVALREGDALVDPLLFA